MLHAVNIGLCLVLTMLAGAAHAADPQTLPLGDFVEWRGSATSPAFKFDDYEITLKNVQPAGQATADAVDIVVTDTSAGTGGKTLTYRTDTHFGGSGWIGVVPFDRDGTQSLIVTSFTGGAHCCSAVTAIYLGDDMRAAFLGAFDGDRVLPEDLDGDGVFELAVGDNRFLYTFDTYANASLPPQIIATRKGARVDVTGAPAFQAVLKEAYEAYHDMCFAPEASEGNPSACAGLLAVATRLGRYDETRAEVAANAKIATGTGYTFYADEAAPKNFDNLLDAVDYALTIWAYR